MDFRSHSHRDSHAVLLDHNTGTNLLFRSYTHADEDPHRLETLSYTDTDINADIHSDFYSDTHLHKHIYPDKNMDPHPNVYANIHLESYAYRYTDAI